MGPVESDQPWVVAMGEAHGEACASVGAWQDARLAYRILHPKEEGRLKGQGVDPNPA
jgi:hypothetical protein